MTLFPDIEIRHLTMQELEAALDHLRAAPKNDGVVELIVRRPQVDFCTLPLLHPSRLRVDPDVHTIRYSERKITNRIQPYYSSA